MYKKVLLFCMISFINYIVAAGGDGFTSRYTIVENGQQYNLVADVKNVYFEQQDAIYKKFSDNLEDAIELKKLMRTYALDLIRYKELRQAIIYLVTLEYERLIEIRNNFIYSREGSMLPVMLKKTSLDKLIYGTTSSLLGLISACCSWQTHKQTSINYKINADKKELFWAIKYNAAFPIYLVIAGILLYKGGKKIFESYDHLGYLNKKITDLRYVINQLSELSGRSELK